MYIVKDPAQVCSIDPVTGVPTASGLGPRSPNYACQKGKMRSGTLWLGIWAAVLMIILTFYEVKAAIMYGVLMGEHGRGCLQLCLASLSCIGYMYCTCMSSKP